MNRDKKVCSLGINDLTESTHNNPYYVKWYSMLHRLSSNPKYADCTIAEEWLLFSNFKAWMSTKNWQNKELDKDLLQSKMYGPNTCVFISSQLNVVLQSLSKLTLNTGVLKLKTRYKTRLLFQGKPIVEGNFYCKELAHILYCKYKIQELIKFKEQETDLIIKNGLTKHIRQLKNRIASIVIPNQPEQVESKIMNKTHSFSTKTEEDFAFVEKLKKEAKLKGRNFSWIVVQALKQIHQANNEDQENGFRRKN